MTDPIDKPRKIAGSWLDEERHPGSVSALADEIMAYGDQCRRAGAAAMREAAADRARWRAPRVRFIDGEQIAEAILALPLPPAAEAASPAAGWRDIASAPQEGQDILVLYDSGEVLLVEADDFTEWKPYKSAGIRGVATPQYWMPVPAPPVPAPSEEARAG